MRKDLFAVLGAFLLGLWMNVWGRVATLVVVFLGFGYTMAEVTWIPDVTIPGLSSLARVAVGMLILGFATVFANWLTAWIKARGGTSGATTQGVAVAMAALVNGLVQIIVSHGWSGLTIANWLLGTLATWFLADGMYHAPVQRQQAALGGLTRPDSQ